MTAPCTTGLLSSSPIDQLKSAYGIDYRPDIDGLRAIAVLAVIGFHAFPARIPGGFVGVDVFFVISGYLISTILLTGMERDSFRFSQFYFRRIRRIFPALIVVLLGCLVMGWLALFSVEYMALGKHVAASAAFVSNFVLWNEAGYFDKVAATKPLLHIWSLGIEEQFYITWPLLLYLTWKRKAAMLTLLLLLLVVSFTLNVRSVHAHPAADFYSPLTRFWELMAGAVLAYLSIYRENLLRNFRKLPQSTLQTISVSAAAGFLASEITAVTGILLIVTSVLTIDEASGFPGWWALLPVLGTCLLIASGPLTWINNKLLAARGLVAIGLISYPLYLWHWPLLSFVRIIGGQTPSPEVATASIFLSVALAWLTYLVVEKPLRFGKSASTKAAILFVAMCTIGSAGYVVYLNNGFAFRNASAEDIAAAAQDYEQSEGLTLGNPDADETILVGDSTMGQYIPRVRKLIEQHAIDLDNNRVIFFLESGCPPIPGIASERNQACAPFVDKVLPTLDKEGVKTVAFTAWWTPEFTDAMYYLRSDPSKIFLRDSEAAQDRALGKFSALISRLVNAGKRVFVLLETPSGNVYDPETSMPSGWRRLLIRPKIPNSPTRSSMDKIVGKTDEKIRRAAEIAGARVIKPMDHLCNKDVCPIVGEDGHFMYFNYGHLRRSYVRDHAAYLDQIFIRETGH
jgi:peptidoglycan/LPS O-acetylase OafA/YrhL